MSILIEGTARVVHFLIRSWDIKWFQKASVKSSAFVDKKETRSVLILVIQIYSVQYSHDRFLLQLRYPLSWYPLIILEKWPGVHFRESFYWTSFHLLVYLLMYLCLLWFTGLVLSFLFFYFILSVFYFLVDRISLRRRTSLADTCLINVLYE